MHRRDFLRGTAALGLLAASRARADAASTPAVSATAAADPLTPPADAPVPVAFLVSDGAVVIDFCGPWEVFQDVNVPGRSAPPFRLYTVGETTRPIRASAGLRIIPEYDLAHAPAPKVVVIPAQSARSEAVRAWIRKAANGADLTMSVCTGAFLLAGAGLLAGKPATTHHGFFRTFAAEFPDVRLQRGARFVEAGSVATAGGLSSGIDLALRVVERYYGRDVASATARYMEYQGQGWLDPASNAAFAEEPASTADHPLCPVCQMEVDARTAPRSTRGGKTYLFCMPEHKRLFDAAPERFLDGAR